MRSFLDRWRFLRLRLDRTVARVESLEATVTDPGTSNVGDALEDYRTTLNLLHEGIGQSDDVVFRPLHFTKTGQEAALVYVKGMTQETKLSRDVLRPLTNPPTAVQRQLMDPGSGLDQTLAKALDAVHFKAAHTLSLVLSAVMEGDAALLVEGHSEALLLTVQGTQGRKVGATKVESVLRGPLEGFVEGLDANLSLIRRRLRDPKLRVESIVVGARSRTKVSICSIYGLVNPTILSRVRQMVGGLEVDALLDSGDLANRIHPRWLHIYPLVLSTERPDRAVLGLLEGRVLVIVNGSPLVLLLPAVYTDFFKAMDDHYLPWVPASMLLLLRNLANHVAALVPAVYVSLASFNPGIVQPQFLLVLASSRAQVPYPPIIEALLTLTLVEFIVEATIRSPKVVGNAIPIVGGIIIGNVLTKTHLASEIMVVVAALGAITQFTSGSEPTIQVFQRLQKYWYLAWAAAFGFFGLMIAVAIQFSYMVSLKSAGVPYFSPAAPFNFIGFLNAKIVPPTRWRARRLAFLSPWDKDARQAAHTLPTRLRNRT